MNSVLLLLMRPNVYLSVARGERDRDSYALCCSSRGASLPGRQQQRPSLYGVSLSLVICGAAQGSRRAGFAVSRSPHRKQIP